MSRNKFFLNLVLFLMIGGLFTFAMSSPAAAGDIVHSIIKAPVTHDGDVAGALTDLVINLDANMDPAVPGRSLLSGRTIKVTLPDDFVNEGKPLGRALSECVPSTRECNTAVLLQGWPQHPIVPPLYELSMEGTHTLVFTALTDITPGVPFPGPGIKQMHLLLSGFTNPKPGYYEIAVEAETGPGGAVENGVGTVQILPKPRPSINVTSTVDPLTPNTMFQTTTVGAEAPWPFDVLMWGKGGDSLVGAKLVWINANHSALRVDGVNVGHVRINAPARATGYSVNAAELSVNVPAPIMLVDTGRMRFHFQAGSVAGDYEVTFTLNGGNTVQMNIEVTE